MNSSTYWGIACSVVLSAACHGSKETRGAGASAGMNGFGGSAGAGGFAAGAGGGAGTAAQGGGDSGATTGSDVTVIQEDELGFGAVDGKILPRQGMTSITGFTGPGFADGDSGLGKSISWSVEAERAGRYPFIWRYAFGGDASNSRDARLTINGTPVLGPVVFPYTTTWNDWQESSPVEAELAAGSNYVRLEALQPSGLANIDYFKILGAGITPGKPRFSLTVGQNDPAAGSVSHAPVQTSYELGATVTLRAIANPGYFFQSFSGDVTSSDPNFTFGITQNTTATALFLPAGTTQDPSLVGYAAVQDDAGTPYIVTGGSLGRSVTAASLAELKGHLESTETLVVSFAGLFQGTEVIHVGSNKTLLGIGNAAQLMGVELEIDGSRNVIIRNIKVSHVVAEGAGVANDAIVISGRAKNIWIDHCELFSDLTHGKDYYDGLLEIKNEASFITVSWSVFHDHFKASLVSSGDDQIADHVIRATYHHNYFRDCGSRLPSIRFGKAHVFNNYYQNNNSGSCINSRMGAVVKAEGNYFENSKDTIGAWDSPTAGQWDVANNIFDRCSGAQPTTSTGSLTLPYAYTVDPAAGVPSLVSASAGVGP